MTVSQIVSADLTWTGSAFERDIQVVIDGDGRITEVGRLGRSPTQRLDRRALLPGMINAHSHAFQRGLRGRGERLPPGTGKGSFWTWRKAMYELVESLDVSGFRAWCALAFSEMLEAGITAVGEFHYLHHTGGRLNYALDDVVLNAAAETGIRCVLLNAFYRTGGIGQPLRGAQRQFASDTTDAYWENMDRLAGGLDPATQSLGVAAHSIRAATPEDIHALHEEAARRNMPLHLHVEEQRREIEECLAAYGRRPMAMLTEVLSSCTGVVAVHCTHTTADDMDRYLGADGKVCLCPLTEGNLGDGIPRLPIIREASDRLSLGTDSNARICMTEEMRWLEYGQRLSGEARGVLADADGQVARALFTMATRNGAAALGLDAGTIAPGCWADLVALDLDARSLAGADPDLLLDAFVFGTGNDAVAATCVGGRWRHRAPPRARAPRRPRHGTS